MNFWVIIAGLLCYIFFSYLEFKGKKVTILKNLCKYFMLIFFLFILFLFDIEFFINLFLNGDLSKITPGQAIILFGVVITFVDIVDMVFNINK